VEPFPGEALAMDGTVYQATGLFIAYQKVNAIR
jgi:hypothetical protein